MHSLLFTLRKLKQHFQARKHLLHLPLREMPIAFKKSFDMDVFFELIHLHLDTFKMK